MELSKDQYTNYLSILGARPMDIILFVMLAVIMYYLHKQDKELRQMKTKLNRLVTE